VALIRIDLAKATSMQPLTFRIQFSSPKASKQPHASCFIQRSTSWKPNISKFHVYTTLSLLMPIHYELKLKSKFAESFMCLINHSHWLPALDIFFLFHIIFHFILSIVCLPISDGKNKIVSTVEALEIVFRHARLIGNYQVLCSIRLMRYSQQLTFVSIAGK